MRAIVILAGSNAKKAMLGAIPKGWEIKIWPHIGFDFHSSREVEAAWIDAALVTSTKQRNRKTKLATAFKKWALKRQAAWLEQRFRKEPAGTAVLIWNGLKGHRGLATKLARKMGLRPIYFEHAPLPGRMQIDARGINADMGISHNGRAYREWASKFSEVEKLSVLKLLHQELIPRTSTRSDVSQNRASVELQEQNFFFCPLQVPGDSQLTHHGGVVKSIEKLIEWLDQASYSLPEGYHIRIKEHPSARKSFKALIEKLHNPKLILDNETSSVDQLKLCQGLITVNSSMGVQAMLYGKPVIVLGNAFYGFAPVSLRAPTPEALAEFVENPGSLAEKVDPQTQSDFLIYLAEIQFPSIKALENGEYTLDDLFSRESMVIPPEN